MPHASVIVPSVIGAAAAAAAFEVTVFRPWRETHAPQGLHILLSDELQKLGRTAEAFANQVGHHARQELQKVQADLQHAAGEVADGFRELTQSTRSPQEFGQAVGNVARRMHHSAEDQARLQQEQRDGGRRSRRTSDANRSQEFAQSSAHDSQRPMYAPAETDYDPDDEETLATLQQRQNRSDAGPSLLQRGAHRYRDEDDNFTLRDQNLSSSSLAKVGVLFNHDDDDEKARDGDDEVDEATAAFRSQRISLGEQRQKHSTIFDLEDFDVPTRNAFGMEDIMSPHHALGSPSIAASESGDTDFFGSQHSKSGVYAGERDALELSAADASNLPASLASLPPPPPPKDSKHISDEKKEVTPASSEPQKAAFTSDNSDEDDEWARASAAPSYSVASDGELVSAAASEAGGARSTGEHDLGGRAVSSNGSEGWIDLEPSSPESLSPPRSPQMGALQRRI
ncbi:hypothetical protein OC845_001288 [Tilletia horrida]|nr:hypothetical protein OC845_001288 [Tilletia horrida]